MIAIENGWEPTWIAGPAVFVAVLIGVTVFASPFATYAVLASGVIATASGPAPTGIAGPATRVRRLIGVTVLSRLFTTYTVQAAGPAIDAVAVAVACGPPLRLIV